RSCGRDTVPMIGPRARASAAPQWIGKACFAPGSGWEVRRIWSVRFERLMLMISGAPKKPTARRSDGPDRAFCRRRVGPAVPADLFIANHSGLSLPKFMVAFRNLLQCTRISLRLDQLQWEQAVCCNRVSAQNRIARLLEEARAGDIFAARRHVRLLLALAAGFEGQLELHARRIIDEQLPQRRA